MVRVSVPASPAATAGRSNSPTTSQNRQPSFLPPGQPQPEPSGVIVAPFTTIADLRERAGGWRFDDLTVAIKGAKNKLLVPLKHEHMITADYSISGLPCYIERKSHDDCIGSIGGGHTNFRKEHERMLTIVEDGGFCCVIVESSLDAILVELDEGLTGRQLNPEAVLSVVASWPQRYRVPWYFAGSRGAAERLAIRVLWKFYDRVMKSR